MLNHDDPAMHHALPVPPPQGMSRRESLRSIGLGAAAVTYVLGLAFGTSVA